MTRAALLSPMALLAALLAAPLALGCGPRPRAEALYAPHEEGLTLIFENPSLPPERTFEARLQVRVQRVTEGQGAARGQRTVDQVFTTLKGQMPSSLILKDGGVLMAGPDHKPHTVLLPPGFPDHTTTWIARERRFTVLGRATATQGYGLPASAPREGIWVEVVPLNGQDPKSRSFYLPDLGEVDYLEFREGRWIPMVRLVSRGFTDAPASKRN